MLARKLSMSSAEQNVLASRTAKVNHDIDQPEARQLAIEPSPGPSVDLECAGAKGACDLAVLDRLFVHA